MFKLIGGVCIFMGCIGIGVNLLEQEKCRIQNLKEVYHIVQRMQDEILYGKRTLPELCALLAKCTGERFRDGFEKLYLAGDFSTQEEIKEIWREQMLCCLSDAHLREEEMDSLTQIPDLLGMQNEKMQAACIGQSLELLKQRMTKAQEGYENKSKMILSVSSLLGIFLIILIL